MSEHPNKAPHERIHALDLIRGVLIIGMLFDHTLYDSVTIFELPWRLYDNVPRHIIQTGGAMLFILLSGMSAPISRNIIKRGLILAVFAAGMTFFSWLGDHDFYIVFGILHFLSFCMLFYGIFGEFLRKADEKTAFAAYAVLFVVTDALIRIGCAKGFYGGASWVIGLRGPDFASLDYFPILPWIFIYLLGTWASPYVFEKKLPEKFYKLRSFKIELIGRYSLWIYLGHQAVLYGVLMLIKDLLG